MTRVTVSLKMEKNQPVIMSMTMKSFDGEAVKKELVMEEERAEEASNVRDSPDSGSSRSLFNSKTMTNTEQFRV